MNLRDLVTALLARDALSVRSLIQDAGRAGVDWSRVPRPDGLGREDLALAAGIVELMVSRAGQTPPAWTADVPISPGKKFLVAAAESLPNLRRLCEEEGPLPLRRRGFLAPPEFLTAA